MLIQSWLGVPSVVGRKFNMSIQYALWSNLSNTKEVYARYHQGHKGCQGQKEEGHVREVGPQMGGAAQGQLRGDGCNMEQCISSGSPKALKKKKRVERAVTSGIVLSKHCRRP
jgi:hypothetical protein